MAHEELARVARGQVPIDMDFDVAAADTRPDLLSLSAFWDSTLGDFWRSQIPPQADSIRHVALPALLDNGRKLYGGMHYGRGVLGSWFFTNVEPGNARRNAYTFLHEFAHSFHAIDICNPQRTAPDLMCAEDYAAFRDGKAPLRYSAQVERQIRRGLGLSAGRRLTVGGR